MTRILDRLAASNGGILAVTGIPGAVGNGLGYRSLSHVTTTPQMEFWRKRFPDTPKVEFETVFNRYSHIIPNGESQPRLLSLDSVGVPIGPFQRTASVRYVPSPMQSHEVDGHIDKVVLEPGRLVVSGWGPWSGPLEAHELEISVAPAASGPPRRSMLIRPDLPAGTRQRVSALNGFSLIIPLSAGATPRALCVVAHDASTGKRTLLQNPPELPYCQRANEANN
jgi:hypothetical protein